MSVPLGPLTRVAVILSILVAVAAGLRPLAAQPAVLISLLATFLIAAAAARWRFRLTAPVVLLFAYISYGLVRLVGGVALAGMPYWLAAFAGMVVGGVSWTRWQARDGWRVPLAWWASSVAFSWPLVAAREISLTSTSSPLIGLIVTAALVQMSLALWMDRLLASRRELRAQRAEPLEAIHWAAPLLASALVTAAAALYQHYVDLTWLSGAPWVGLRRAVGMMGDANPMGVATGLWAPLGWAMLAAGGGVGTLIGALLATALWMAAWVSGARTSLILFGAAVFGLASMWAIGHRLPRRALAVAALAAILLGTAVVAGLASRPAPGTPVARLVAALPSTSPGAVLYELLWRRDGYGLAAAAAIKDHPLLGVGVGRFTPLSTAYHQRLTGRAIPPDNAQNLWRHTLAEQGLLGFLPLLWLTMLSLRAVLAGAAAGDDLVLRVMVAALGLALLVGYPVQDAAIAVTVGTLAAALGCARADAMRNL